MGKKTSLKVSKCALRGCDLLIFTAGFARDNVVAKAAAISTLQDAAAPSFVTAVTLIRSVRNRFVFWHP
jgi:hypothetical protein